MIQNSTYSKLGIVIVLITMGLFLVSNSYGQQKSRVIHTTDMGFDDENTLIRMLLFANSQEILGITPSGGPWQGQINNEVDRILDKIDLYEQVYDNLIKHDSDYPTPAYLRSVSVEGNLDYGDYSIDTDGSMLIANALLDESDDSPIWVTCWGGPVTVTAALRYINDNYPDKKAYVAKKLKIYHIAARWQDTPERVNTSYIINHYNPAPVMIDNLAWSYTNDWGAVKYWCDNAAYSTESWTNTNYNQSHGALANSFHWKNGYNDDVDGDAPSLLHILGSSFGLRSTEDPTYGGWGSRFEAGTDNYKCHINYDVLDEWESANKLPDTDENAWLQLRCYLGARWADEFQNDLAVRADWSVLEYSEANHAPVVELKILKDLRAPTGQLINLECDATDPDGDNLSYRWWQYKDAGTLDAAVTINNADTKNASFECPAGTGTIHIILEVKDDGKGHPLTRYARVIVEVGDYVYDPLAPSAPTGLSATLLGNTEISLDWADNTDSDFVSYNLKRSPKVDGTYTNVVTVLTNSEYSDADLLHETSYHYIVTAVDAAGNESEFSTKVSVTTPGYPEPRSYYDFNEVSGTSQIADLGPEDNTGTLVGETIEWSSVGGIVLEHPDANQGCLRITGATNSSASYFEIPYASFHNSSSYTYSTWVKWDTSADAAKSHLFWQNGDDTEIGRHVDMWWNTDNNSVASTLHDDNGDELNIIPESQEGLNMFDGEWHQVAITLKNDTLISIFADGKLIAQEIAAYPIATTSSNNLLLACFPGNIANDSKMLGFIDRVRLYDVALTQDEVLHVYNGEEASGPFPDAPVGVTATGVNYMINLDWDDHIGDDLDHYVVMRSETSGGPYEEIKTLTSSSHIDIHIEYETAYYYTIIVVNKRGYESDMSAEVSAASLAVGISETVPESMFELQQNRPNPFTSETIINYELKEGGFVELQIVDLAGRIVNILEKSEKQTGSYEVKWNPKSETEGAYFYKLTVSSSRGVFSDIKKMVLY